MHKDQFYISKTYKLVKPTILKKFHRFGLDNDIMLSKMNNQNELLEIVNNIRLVKKPDAQKLTWLCNNEFIFSQYMRYFDITKIIEDVNKKIRGKNFEFLYFEENHSYFLVTILVGFANETVFYDITPQIVNALELLGNEYSVLSVSNVDKETIASWSKNRLKQLITNTILIDIRSFDSKYRQELRYPYLMRSLFEDLE